MIEGVASEDPVNRGKGGEVGRSGQRKGEN